LPSNSQLASRFVNALRRMSLPRDSAPKGAHQFSFAEGIPLDQTFACSKHCNMNIDLSASLCTCVCICFSGEPQPQTASHWHRPHVTDASQCPPIASMAETRV
jgi:hypothetical protein